MKKKTTKKGKKEVSKSILNKDGKLGKEAQDNLNEVIKSIKESGSGFIMGIGFEDVAEVSAELHGRQVKVPVVNGAMSSSMSMQNVTLSMLAEAMVKVLAKQIANTTGSKLSDKEIYDAAELLLKQAKIVTDANILHQRDGMSYSTAFGRATERAESDFNRIAGLFDSQGGGLGGGLFETAKSAKESLDDIREKARKLGIPDMATDIAKFSIKELGLDAKGEKIVIDGLMEIGETGTPSGPKATKMADFIRSLPADVKKRAQQAIEASNSPEGIKKTEQRIADLLEKKLKGKKKK